MSWLQKPPKPKTLLGYHRILSPNAGIRVSPLCLGTMNFGDAWGGFMGECNKETTFQILDTFFGAGGNFIDTANHYQNGESELWLGEWMQRRKIRDQIVLATKFTTASEPKDASGPAASNFQGNHSKSLKLSLEASLEKLQTSYVDLLYVHWWDFSTGHEEVMRSLHHMVASGKVLYLGISDTPAWKVVQCNAYARQHGLTPFSVYQGNWSAACRDFERDIIPMCESEGMGLAPWGSLGRGMFKSAEEYASGGRKFGPQNEKYRRMGEKLAALAKAKNTVPTSIALAYVMHKTPYVFPIIGGRKVEHLKSNIDALAIHLTDEEIDEIEASEEFDAGFPMSFLFGPKYSTRMTTADIKLVSANAPLEAVPKIRSIVPGQGERFHFGN